MPNREPSEELKRARRLLEDVSGYERLGDFCWDNHLGQWVLQVRLTIDGPGTDYVSPATEWHIIIDPQYPLGQIAFMPDAQRGIKHTFQHQNYNRLLENAKWRTGKVCLDTSQGSWGRKKYSAEPTDARNRLKWHVERCLLWLAAAATNTLVEPDDPYELPAFPTTTSYRLVFNEDEASFVRWQSTQRKNGLFFYHSLGHQSETYPISRFDILTEEDALEVWGTYINNRNKEEKTGVWLMLNQLPVMQPWQVPSTFKELAAVCHEQGIDLIQTLLKAYIKLKRRQIRLDKVALGFPVPSRIGFSNELIHWFAFELSLPRINGKQNNEAAWENQFNVLFSRATKIQWVKTENWNFAQLTNRGHVAPELAGSQILFIGAGALSATLAELFGRLGCRNLTFIDYDKIQAGNLSRHTLTLGDVGKNKAEALSAHLNSLFPFHQCNYRKQSIDEILTVEPTFLDRFDVVIDATAEDDVIQLVSDHLSNKTAHFFSVSTGFNADRLYCFMCSQSGFEGLQNEFKAKIDPLLRLETAAIKGASEIIEGIGCWHPLFPARIDDIQMLAGAAFKLLEQQVSHPQGRRLVVIEKQYAEEEFTGVTIKNA